VTTSGKFSSSFDDLLSDLFVTLMDDKEKPCCARCVSCSGVAREVAMAEAMVPHPRNPALIGCRAAGGEEESVGFVFWLLAVDIV